MSSHLQTLKEQLGSIHGPQIRQIHRVECLGDLLTHNVSLTERVQYHLIT